MMLEVRDLTLTIPAPQGEAVILDGVSFELSKGDTLGLVGESGCGKSMTALSLMGLAPEQATLGGSLRLDGTELLGMPEAQLCRHRGARIAMIFQEPMTALNPLLPVGAQIAEGLRLQLGMTRHEANERARHHLDRVGLGDVAAQTYPHQLSGGQRQRVVIAIALAFAPDILIADEPTTALDVTVQAQILDLILEGAAEADAALLMITHDLGVIAETVDRMAVMYAGRVVEMGATEAVFAAPAHPYTRGLFAALPQSADVQGGKRPRLADIPGTVPDPAARPEGCPFRPRCNHAEERCQSQPPMMAHHAESSVACWHVQDSAR